jgi:DNA-binding IscR family transcriptional regulator
MSKLTDYGTVVLAELANGRTGFVSAAEVAQATGLGLPTVSKLLKTLAKAGLVTSTRGSHGGYHCGLEPVCSVGTAWQRINVAIRRALDEISLADLLRANSPTPRFRFAGMPINVERKS